MPYRESFPRPYPTLRALRRGETIDFEGVPLVTDEGELLVGDTYIAERNTGPHLLTVQRFVMVPPKYGEIVDFVIPKESAYCFDGQECVKVKMVE